MSVSRVIERLHKEFKQRTKPMEIVAGEESVYRILAFVAMKIEVSWRNAPFRSSGFRKLKPFAGYFTHEVCATHQTSCRCVAHQSARVVQFEAQCMGGFPT